MLSPFMHICLKTSICNLVQRRRRKGIRWRSESRGELMLGEEGGKEVEGKGRGGWGCIMGVTASLWLSSYKGFLTLCSISSLHTTTIISSSDHLFITILSSCQHHKNYVIVISYHLSPPRISHNSYHINDNMAVLLLMMIAMGLASQCVFNSAPQ